MSLIYKREGVPPPLHGATGFSISGHHLGRAASTALPPVLRGVRQFRQPLSDFGHAPYGQSSYSGKIEDRLEREREEVTPAAK